MKFIRISSSWCASCIVTNKTWKQLQQELPDNEYIEYDYDMDNEVNDYNVGEVLPVIIVMKDNQEIKRFIGEKSLKEILGDLK